MNHLIYQKYLDSMATRSSSIVKNTNHYTYMWRAMEEWPNSTGTVLNLS